MKLNLKHWPIATLNSFKKNINPTPVYQRGAVWKLEQKQLLIDSLLRRIDIPKIYLRAVKNQTYRYEIIDGQQRLNAIWEFLADAFPLNENAQELILDDGSNHVVADCKFSDLHTDVQIERINNFPVDVVVAEEATEDEIADLFFRLNNGTPLTSAEVRNSMVSAMRDLIHKFAKHPAMKNMSFTNRRYAFDQALAQCMLLEIAEGPCDLSEQLLTKLYADYATSVPRKYEANMEYFLDFMVKAFKAPSRLLKKGQLINLYLLIRHLHGNGRLKTIKPSEFYDWYLRSETDRLRETEYANLMRSSLNKKISIMARFQILLLDFNKKFPNNSVPLDPKRIFDDSEKIQIYQKNSGICQNPSCGKKVTETGWHADHIIPWIKGGRTQVSNAQVLCVRCNLKKKDSLW
jgi:hypothetical protein